MHMITTAVGIALAFTLGLTQLFGPAVQGNIQPETSRANVCAARFVDMNDDGICDNRCGGGNFVDADGDGICGNRGSQSSCGNDGNRDNNHCGRGKHCK